MTGAETTMVLSGVAQLTRDTLNALPASGAIAEDHHFSVQEVLSLVKAMGIDLMGTKADSPGAANKRRRSRSGRQRAG